MSSLSLQPTQINLFGWCWSLASSNSGLGSSAGLEGNLPGSFTESIAKEKRIVKITQYQMKNCSAGYYQTLVIIRLRVSETSQFTLAHLNKISWSQNIEHDMRMCSWQYMIKFKYPYRNLIRTILRWRIRPVPVVFLLLALTDQLTIVKKKKHYTNASF